MNGSPKVQHAPSYTVGNDPTFVFSHALRRGTSLSCILLAACCRVNLTSHMVLSSHITMSIHEPGVVIYRWSQAECNLADLADAINVKPRHNMAAQQKWITRKPIPDFNTHEPLHLRVSRGTEAGRIGEQKTKRQQQRPRSSKLKQT